MEVHLVVDWEGKQVIGAFATRHEAASYLKDQRYRRRIRNVKVESIRIYTEAIREELESSNAG